MITLSESDLQQLQQRFIQPEVQALALMGSFARGDAGPFSDIDLICLTNQPLPPLPYTGSHLFNGRLLVVSQVSPDETTAWFTEPERAVNTIAGLRTAQPLHDPTGYFATLQQQAHVFTWDAAMQTKANAYASQQMVGWIEEVHKALEGLRRNDIGRMLNALHGLTWGLARVLLVQRGILLIGENTFFRQIVSTLGAETPWVRHWQIAFGLLPPTSLAERVQAGLHVYLQTAVMLQPILTPSARPLVEDTVALITQQIPLRAKPS